MNYPHLLSPVTIGKVTLKNRISSPDASLHLLQGPETFPADGYRAWVIQMAKSCAYLVMSPWSNPTQRTIGMADSARSRSMSAPRSRACCVMVSSRAGPETSGTPG